MCETCRGERTMKKLKFKKKSSCEEWNVLGYKNSYLGDIAVCDMFKKYSFFPDTDSLRKDISITSDCHREIADFLDEINSTFNWEEDRDVLVLKDGVKND